MGCQPLPGSEGARPLGDGRREGSRQGEDGQHTAQLRVVGERLIGTDRAQPSVSPLNATDFSGLPPAYVMLAGYDPMRDEGRAYAEKLRAAGVAVTIADYPDLVHCFIYLQTVLPQANAAMTAAAKAVRAALDAA